MSLKDIFLKNTTVINQISPKEINQEVESENYLTEHKIDKEQFVPTVDFEDPKNFVFFGSAKKLYLNAISRIYNTYPYDGSRAEKLSWHNSSSYFDKWFYENKYPKTTGYAVFSGNGWGTKVGSTVSGYGEPVTKEYIQVKGGPNTASAGMSLISNSFINSNVYDADTNRLSNLRLNANNGSTVEFWLKKNSFNTSNTEKEVIFDLWNNELSSSQTYGRLTIELSGNNSSPFYVTLQSGTYGFYNQQISSTLTTASLTDWHHYAFSFKNNDVSGIDVKFYYDGNLQTTSNFGTSIQEVSKALIANIGSLRTAPSGVLNVAEGWGKLSGSIDDFRYWKTKRTSQQIGRYWWTNIDGGSNTDDYNTNIGVYYKFNEGITNIASRDSVVLDYSGRVSNGVWVGYSTYSRNTSSAITEYSSVDYTETQDPIIYSNHPDVVTSVSNYTYSGSYYDFNNPSSIYNSLPQWILDEDSENGERLLELISILSSYLDKLYLQIKSLPTLKNQNNFISGSLQKPLPYSKELLKSSGLVSPELFIDANLFEEILSRTDNNKFEEKLNDIKNIIYQNIYSNLINIYKSKGTEKSYRNLLHCFGIDERLVNINLYSSNVEFEYKNNIQNIAIKKKMVDFNNGNRRNSTIYQSIDSNNTNSKSYFTGSLETLYTPFTLETEVFFPVLQLDFDDTYKSELLKSSLFGIHTAKNDGNDYTWNSNDYANFQVFSNKLDYLSKGAYFSLSSSYPFPIPLLTSSYYYDVYDNTKWNFSVTLKPTKYFNNFVSGSTLSSSTSTTSDINYELVFSGINTISNTIVNEFSVSSSIPFNTAKNFIISNKRVYAGAERTNFTGSVLHSTDVRLSDIKYWIKELTRDELLAHSSDLENYGTTNPLYNSLFYNLSSSNFSYIQNKTLLMHLNFENVTSSDSNGQFTIIDASSGSITNNYQYPNWLSEYANTHYTARGDFFDEDSSDVIDINYIVSAKQKLPEIINSSDMVNILTQDDDIFTSNSRPTSYQINFEKSMYQTISSEMLNMFATIKDFNNLVGNPIYKYRTEYKELKYLAQTFFNNVQNEPDLDKYLDFYKWFDSSLGSFLIQLTPASADTSNSLMNVVESHVLERNKYQHKFPSLEFKQRDLESGAVSINRHLYNWRVGYRPINNLENTNCFYWNERAERNVTPISSSNSDVNNSRSYILSASLQVLNRSFTTTYKFNIDQSKEFKGGVNFEPNKNIEFAKNALAPHGPLDTDDIVNLPANYLVSLIQNTSSLLIDCNDELIPNNKTKYYLNVVQGRDYLSSSLNYGEVLNSKIAFPANLISSSINTGYQAQVQQQFMSGVLITNIHNDVYGPINEVPIQGPFTNAWVGGKQSRHVNINSGNDNYTTRPEEWKIVLGIFNTSSYQTAIGFVGADYPYPEGNPFEPSYPVVSHKRATYFREETAKRPVNIRNIQSTTGSSVLGNYSNTYEVLHCFGATSNNKELIDAATPINNNELYGIVRTDVVDGRVDFTLPTRQKYQTIVRNKFSSPGDYRTNSRGYLTVYSEETSPYNSLPFRNRQIIGNGFRNGDSLTIDTTQYPQIVANVSADLNTLTARYSDHGYQPASTTLASFHKVNKNSLTTVNYNENTYSLQDDNDNGFISHAIPQSDENYSWVTASLAPNTSRRARFSSGSRLGPPRLFSSFTTPSGSTSEFILNTFVSCSDLGSYYDTIGANGRVFPEDVTDISLGGKDQFLPLDFVGLNTLVYETSSFTTLGQTVTDYAVFVNMDIIDTISPNKNPIFSALLQHRGGVYGYPIFKQTRVGEHKVARKLKDNNYISIFKGKRGFEFGPRAWSWGEGSTFDDFFGFTYDLTNIQRFTFYELGVELYKEPTLELNSLSLKIYVKDINSTEQENIIKLETSYENLIKNFSNNDLNLILNLPKFKNEVTLYDIILTLQALNNPRYVIENIEYETVVLPNPQNITFNTNRQRTNFNFNWNNTRADRRRRNVNNIF
jgi:hypothetical protein